MHNYIHYNLLLFIKLCILHYSFNCRLSLEVIDYKKIISHVSLSSINSSLLSPLVLDY